MIYLVACSAQKQLVSPEAAVPAQELYTSLLFRKARRYAEQEVARDPGRRRWAILSARYGLLIPGALVPTYDETLPPQRDKRFAWAAGVDREVETWAAMVNLPRRAVFLAGERYREPLGEMLRARGWRVEVPMLGLGIGRQLAWLKQHTERSGA